MTDKLLEQLILQAPTVAALLYLLFRLDQRISALIQTIIDLSERTETHAANARLDALARRDRE